MPWCTANLGHVQKPTELKTFVHEDFHGICNIPRDYYLKINIKTNNCFKSHLDKKSQIGKIPIY